MNQDNRGSSVGFFLAGAVVGGAIGATVALLFAPQSGEETRKYLAKRAKEAGEDFEDMRKSLEPKFKKAKKDFAKKLSE